jgi:transposase
VVYGPLKTLYNRWMCWSRMGVSARMLVELADAGRDDSLAMIDATHLKTHRTASSPRGQKGGARASSGARKAACTPSCTPYATPWADPSVCS